MYKAVRVISIKNYLKANFIVTILMVFLSAIKIVHLADKYYNSIYNFALPHTHTHTI